eukprot:3842595-Amphidinium_carterae.2
MPSTTTTHATQCFFMYPSHPCRVYGLRLGCVTSFHISGLAPAPRNHSTSVHISAHLRVQT